jgi:hypothetical protein
MPAGSMFVWTWGAILAQPKENRQRVALAALGGSEGRAEDHSLGQKKASRKGWRKFSSLPRRWRAAGATIAPQQQIPPTGL